MIRTHFNTSIKILRSNNEGEYCSSDLQSYLRENNIIHQTTYACQKGFCSESLLVRVAHFI
jgi:hypothetical protein